MTTADDTDESKPDPEIFLKASCPRRTPESDGCRRQHLGRQSGSRRVVSPIAVKQLEVRRRPNGVRDLRS